MFTENAILLIPLANRYALYNKITNTPPPDCYCGQNSIFHTSKLIFFFRKKNTRMGLLYFYHSFRPF